MSKTDALSPLQLSAVQELANIGLGRAAMALSDLTGQTYSLGVPDVHASGLDDVPTLIQDPDTVYGAVLTGNEGDFDGTVAFLFDWPSVQALCSSLAGDAPETPDAVTELQESVILEIGNILNGSFVNALAELSGLTIWCHPPVAGFADPGSILSSVAAEAEMAGAMALSVNTHLEALSGVPLRGSFLCIPGPQGLSPIFAALGLETVA
ncbi:MAG: chemotaxis protein CheC [Fimbriimonadaceae bacterium]|nr:chemotaxis protein CheC [Fimbriimonadaceae bacterium]